MLPSSLTNKLYVLMFLLLVAAILPTHAQVVDWVRIYSLFENSNINDAVLLPDGGYFLVGSGILPDDSGGMQGLVIRTNNNGQMLWWRTYGGMTADYFWTAALVNGEIWVGGTVDSTGHAWYISTLWRLSLNGDSLWSCRYPNLSSSIEKVKPYPNGGILVTTGSGCILGRINAEGTVVWIVNVPFNHGPIKAIDVLADGSTVVACPNVVRPSDTLAINVYWIDANGHIEDMNQHYPGIFAGAESLIALSDSDAVVAGWIQTGGAFNHQSPYMFRIRRSGLAVWEVTQNDQWSDHAVSIHAIQNSLIMVTWSPFSESGWRLPCVNSYTLDGHYDNRIGLIITPGHNTYSNVSTAVKIATNRILIVGSGDMVGDTVGYQAFCAGISVGSSAVEPQNDRESESEQALRIEYTSRTGRITLPENPVGAVQVNVYDILGRCVHHSTQMQTTREFMIPLDITSGTFFITVSDTRKQWSGIVHIIR